MKSIILIFVGAAALAACATTPQTPAQGIYALEGAYAGALALAVQYKSLPVCSSSSTALCQSPNVLRTLQTSDDVAHDALFNAEGVVRTPGVSDSNIALALASARGAINAFVAITSDLQVK